MAYQISPQARELLEFLAESDRDGKRVPTMRDVCERFDLASTNTAHNRLRRLIAAGYVVHAAGSRRWIVITPAGWALLGLEPPSVLAAADAKLAGAVRAAAANGEALPAIVAAELEAVA